MRPPWGRKEQDACSEREAKPAAQRDVPRLVIEVDPVIRDFSDEADAAREREIAVHSALETVIRLFCRAALLDRNGLIGDRPALTVEPDAAEESGRSECFGEAVVDDSVDMLDLSLGDVGARFRIAVEVLEGHRALDLSGLDLEVRAGIELHGVVNLANGIAELEFVADADSRGLIAMADQAFAAADENAEFRGLGQCRRGGEHQQSERSFHGGHYTGRCTLIQCDSFQRLAVGGWRLASPNAIRQSPTATITIPPCVRRY